MKRVWDPECFGELLRDARTEARLSQEKLAYACGCSRTHICNYEAGRSGPSIGMLYLLADAIGCRLEDLLP